MLTINRNISPLLSRMKQNDRFNMQKHKNLFPEDQGDTVEFSTGRNEEDLNKLANEYVKEYGNAAMIKAVTERKPEIILNLHYIDPAMITAVNSNNGFTPLHYAAHIGDIRAIRILNDLNPGLINEGNHAGKTPLDLARNGGHTEAAEILERFSRENTIDTVYMVSPDPETTQKFQRFMSNKPGPEENDKNIKVVWRLPQNSVVEHIFKQFMNSGKDPEKS